MANLGVAGVVIAIILLVILSLKGFNIFLASMIATVIVAVSNMMNPLNALIEGYAPGLASFLGNYFFIFLFGLWMGKVMSITGATEIHRAGRCKGCRSTICNSLRTDHYRIIKIWWS